MTYLAASPLSADFPTFLALRQHFGFVPAVFRDQSLLPRAIEAEGQIAAAVLITSGALTRVQKELILVAIAGARANAYCVAAHSQFLRSLGVSDSQARQAAIDHRQAGLAASDVALIDFALKLSQRPTWVGPSDIEALRCLGFTDRHILEATQVAALTEFLCTVTTGLGCEPEYPVGALEPRRLEWVRPLRTDDKRLSGPHLHAPEQDPDSFAPFQLFRSRFGFVPNIFRAQTLRSDILAAEAQAVDAILLTEDVLSRKQKECILLAVSATNLNTYCVAVHCEMLRALGVPVEDSDQIAVAHQDAPLSASDKALLDFALKLSQTPAEYGAPDVDRLRSFGYTDAQILECIVMTALTGFLNTLQMGLGTTPDFEPRRVFPPAPNPGSTPAHLTPARSPGGGGSLEREEEARLVARSKAGDLDAFETLLRHTYRPVIRTTFAMTGNQQDAEDCVQNAMLNAYRGFGSFQSEARFSTWLTRIAMNEVLQLRRRRQPAADSLDSAFAEDSVFRPRHVTAWEDNPEQLYAKAETRALVEQAMMKLPPPYRAAVLLRDFQQMTAEEAATALNLEVANLKSRLHRGRMMLRELLAPVFARRDGGVRVSV